MEERTALSAGLLIRRLLTESESVGALTRDVFPVVSPEGARLPYVMYRRGQMDQAAVKRGGGADAVSIEVICYAETYEGCIELAEAVRGALDGRQAEGDGLVMRSCHLTDSEEGWEDDAYVEQLLFTVRI